MLSTTHILATLILIYIALWLVISALALYLQARSRQKASVAQEQATVRYTAAGIVINGQLHARPIRTISNKRRL